MKKKLIILSIPIIGIIICSLFIMFNAGFRIILKNNGIAFKIPETEEDIVNSYLEKKYITITENDASMGYDYEDAGVTVLISGIDYGNIICDMRDLSVDRYLPETSELIRYIKDTRTEYSDGVLELDDEYNLIAVKLNCSNEEAARRILCDELEISEDIIIFW